MRLQAEGEAALDCVTDQQVRTTILALRSYGPRSFAALMAEDGSYIQIAGGSTTCMIERRESASLNHFRAYKNSRHKVFPDGTLLAFGGGSIRLAADEWFTAEEAIEIFLAFLENRNLSSLVGWRDISSAVGFRGDVSPSEMDGRNEK